MVELQLLVGLRGVDDESIVPVRGSPEIERSVGGAGLNVNGMKVF